MARAIVLLWMLVYTHGAMAQTAFTSDDVQTVQQALADEHYEVGEIDGRFGKATANAIRQYQSDWQLPQTGEISRDLIDRLMGNHPATQSQWSKIEDSDCVFWSGKPRAQESLSWTGACTNGKASGSGELTWRIVRAGDVQIHRYEGEVRDGKFNGHGVFTYATGNRYEGEFRDDNFNGHGVYTYANGDRYEGEFRDGKFNGQGVYTWANGDRYEGEVRDDKRHGQGVFTWANGDRYEGEYRDSKPNGTGTYTNSGVTYSGNWTNGCLRTKSNNIAVHTSMDACGY